MLALAYVSQISDIDLVIARFIESLNGLDAGWTFRFSEHLPDGVPQYRLLPIATLRSSFGYAVITEGPEISGADQAVFRNAFQFLAVLLENRVQALALESKNESLLKEIKLEKSLVRTVLDTLPVGVWVADKNGAIVMGNAANAHIRIGSGEMGRAGWSGAGTPIDPADWGIARAIKAGETVTDQEIAIEEAKGSYQTILHSAAPLFNEQGAVIGAIGVNQNITERKKTEQAIRESENKFKQIFEAANVGKSMTALSGRIEVNKAFCDLLGYPPKELKNKTWQELTPPDEIETIQKRLDSLIDGKEDSARFNKRYIHKDGSLIWTDVSVALRRDSDGKPINFITTIVDITERKRAEAEKEKLEAQLIQAQKMESVGRLAGGVAHDYNNMLSIILGYCEMAMERLASDDPVYADIQEIFKAANRSADITRQLLAFARRQTADPQVLDLNERIESILKMIRRLIGEDIDLAWLPGSQLGRIRIDPSQIDQILANLCVNARDAIAGVGKVTIETQNVRFDRDYCARHLDFVPGDYVLLAVSDDGVGMAPEILDNIFEPFFTTKQADKGTGLGLSTVYGIVKQNNGFINVYSEPGKGTTVNIHLPQDTAPDPPKHQKRASKIPLSQGETLLMVEDDRAILKLGKIMLESLGYQVLAASTPGEAMALAESHADAIELLIADVVMPEMNGRQLSEQLQMRLPNLKTLFMSGYTANVIAHRGVLDEGVFFIQKPFSRKDIAVKLRELLDGC